MVTLYVIAWMLTGSGSFIFWWTSDYDLEVKDLFMVIFASIFGPISFVVGFIIHGPRNFTSIGSKILMKKRNNEKHD